MLTRLPPSVSQCGGTTHVLRLSWSPDGQYLVSAHAMNNSGPTAQIVERDGWKTNMDFVGHRKAVTVVVSPLQESERRLRYQTPASHPPASLVVLVCVSAEVQPKDFQEEAEERQQPEAQLPVLLLRRGQQRPLALRLGQLSLHLVVWQETRCSSFFSPVDSTFTVCFCSVDQLQREDQLREC